MVVIWSIIVSLTVFCSLLTIQVEVGCTVLLRGHTRNETSLSSSSQMLENSSCCPRSRHTRPAGDENSKSRYLGQQSSDFDEETVIVSGNSTIVSQNRSFELGFFTCNGGLDWYLGTWYASIPIQTYVWVANREASLKNTTLAKLRLTQNGQLEILASDGFSVWQTQNTERAEQVKLLDTGNLILISHNGQTVWESFDYPTDTWLPGMTITRLQSLTCWRSSSDPSPGSYALRLKQPEYGEFELAFNQTQTYWSTGKWAGTAFSGVPEMTVPYIYNFTFQNPFTTSASFVYTEVSTENSLKPPLTRFTVNSDGQLKQFTWSSQNEHWNMFWSRPDNICRVYGLCGNFGICTGHSLNPCECLNGFHPADDLGWKSRHFTGGCQHDSESLCSENDVFEDIGFVSYDVAFSVSFPASRSVCEASCLKNCSCIGLNHNERSDMCRNLYGSVLNLRNITLDSTLREVLHIRNPRGVLKKNKWRRGVLIGGVCGLIVVFGLVVFGLLVWHKKSKRKKEEDIVFPVTSLKVFTYKELYAATRAFSEKLGHGGFGAVFRGELSDSSLIAVKRLERPGGGEKEFRAEVCTIGNIQHVNLARLRGFCSENSHRLLVYDYMRNGPLSAFLRKDGQTMSWDVRFRVAVGTARGIAYLHEECRDCIIHCDIKPENILLDDEFTAKVSDFGMAKLVGRDFSRVITTMRGTWGYVAPEWISGVAITAKADVYSYGMTLFEIIGGRRNVEKPPSAGDGEVNEGLPDEKWFFPPWAARQITKGNVASVLDDRLLGGYNIAEAERVALVAVWCIQDEESARPTMGAVVKMLEGTVEISVPPSPQLLQALVSGDSFHGVRVSTEQYPSTGGECSDDNQISVASLSP